MSPLAVLLGIMFCALVAGVVVVLVSALSPESRAVRRASKADAAELATARQQLNVATNSLLKIAAEDAGNPALEARLALDDIARKEVT